ncbi:MAG: alpha/beta fold hydrolase [Donghicola eburneus]|nr:alpha/beta hydrolase [Donghicola eburneus]MCI5040861.1 alpha/beta fold hydrolase [Donghicola eburneus]
MADNPEIGCQIVLNGLKTNYHDVGEGAPVVFVHGSGPGVSAWANWRLNLGPLADQGYRCLAPDMAGFGYSDAPVDLAFSRDLWVGQLAAFIDSLTDEPVHLIGNSFGGAIALAYAIRFPDRLDKLVLMGAVGVDFPITDALDRIWGHEASLENMQAALRLFAHDHALLSDDLAELRHRACLRPGVMEAFSAMFPAPRQEALRALASDEEAIAALDVPALVLHGREDKVIPPEVSRRLFALLPNSELHMFGGCGHWTQIEKTNRFNTLVCDFLK